MGKVPGIQIYFTFSSRGDVGVGGAGEAGGQCAQAPRRTTGAGQSWEAQSFWVLQQHNDTHSPGRLGEEGAFEQDLLPGFGH